MMPRLSTCKRGAVVVLAFCSMYFLARNLLIAIGTNYRPPPFQQVRSRFRNELFATARPSEAFENLNDSLCTMNSSCTLPLISVQMVSESHFSPPEACLSRNALFKKAEIVKGLNIAVLSESGRVVEEVRYLNLLDGDHGVIEFLAQVADHKFIVVASYGDVAARLTAESRQLLGLFGSSLLEDYKPGTSLLFIGQYGLSNLQAFERVNSLDIANPAVYSNCISVPMGRLTNLANESKRTGHRVHSNLLPELSAVKGRKMDVTFGSSLPNCGLAYPCPSNQIAMSFYSGKDKNDSPKLCVDGRYVIDKDVNDGGRGLNLVVLDPKTRQVMRCGHFDTYDKESTDLVLFLEQLAFGEIVAVVSFDEASSRLSDVAKKIFYELGSSLIYSLKFRASWYLVGQKGIDGFTPFEDLNLPSGNDWARAISRKICVPLNLNGLKSQKNASTSVAKNSPRRHFCERYDGYEEFCDEDRLDEVIVPRRLSDRSRSMRRIFSYPILLAGGLSANNIRLCLESLYTQEGISPQNIVVAYDAAYPEIAELAALFHTRLLLINDSSSYSDLLIKSLTRMMTFFPSADCIIVIEEDVTLSPDFLFFLDQLLDEFLNDTTANVILTWNRNGFVKTSSISSAVYRVENFQCSAAFLLKRAAYETHIKGKEKKCCSEEATRGGWLLPGVAYMPDVSRVSVSMPAVFDALPEEQRKLFREPRVNTSKANEKLLNADRMSEDEYDSDLRQLLMECKRVVLSRVADCQPGSALAAPVSNLNLTTGEAFAVTFPEQEGSLSVLARCFHLHGSEASAHETYKGIVRFSFMGHPAILVPLTSSIFESTKLSETLLLPQESSNSSL